jgi:hypothetical protein
MSIMTGLTVRPATPDRWEDVVRVMGSPNSAAPADEPDPADLRAITCFVVPSRRRRRAVAHGC